MSRKFRDASQLLHHLLDRHEQGIVKARAYPDHAGFQDIVESDRFDRELRRAASAGSIVVVNGTGRQADGIVRVDLLDAGALYAYLGRVSSSTEATAAASRVFDGLTLHPELEAVAGEVIEAWSRNRQWSGVVPGHVEALRDALRLAQAIFEDKHRGLDYRTFSRRVTGASKQLERLEQPVLRLLSAVIALPSDRDARIVLSELGLDRFGPPLLLSGPIALEGFAVPASLPYVGLPAWEVGRVGFRAIPDYVLSIENQTSFNRQVLEIDAERRGLVLYTGGYPSLDIQRAISHLASSLPAVPFFHWSDIDPEGTWIFRTVERAAGKRISPHLMGRDLAQSRGSIMPKEQNRRRASYADSGIADLVRYFEEPEAKWLEQEELDPELPSMNG